MPTLYMADEYLFIFIKSLNMHTYIDGRKILVNIKVNDLIITLVNVSAPNYDKVLYNS